MDFHEDLSQLGEKEGLKGQKMSKAVESFTWNITVLKVIIAAFFFFFQLLERTAQFDKNSAFLSSFQVS